jgi:hypothetical protein
MGNIATIKMTLHFKIVDPLTPTLAFANTAPTSTIVYWPTRSPRRIGRTCGQAHRHGHP